MGDPVSIPELGRSAGEGIGYPLQYSWVSVVPQLVKNVPAIWETWDQSLGWEDLEKWKATHSSILAWRIPWTVQSMGSQSQTDWAIFTFTSLVKARDSMHRRAQWATVHRATKSQTWLRMSDKHIVLGFPGGAGDKEPACQCRRHKHCGFDSWIRKIPWRKARQPNPVFLPG